jgi:hypothetical protein
VHVGDSIDYRVDPSGECSTMLQNTLTRPDFYFPSRIEEVGAWEHGICMA